MTREQGINASLAERLRARIRREGAISFHDWMAAALYDEREGYYCRTDASRWGRAGDYRTSPELSPLFAATFASYFASLYEDLNAPAEFSILEAGAGAGHFARGVLETLERSFPKLFTATRYLIDEASANARELTRNLLRGFEKHYEFLPLDKITKPFNAGIIFTNELLDALPVHRVRLREGKLLELCVGLNDAGEFIWTETPPTTPRLASYFDDSGIRLCEGQSAEVNLAAGDWLCHAANALKQGYIITVDYGAEADELYDAKHRPHGTLRGFHRHRLTDDVLSQPGAQDITTTIDWTSLKRTGEQCGLETISFERQDQFLLNAGLLAQLERMTLESKDEAAATILRASAREMILPGGISFSFQVLMQRKI